MVFNLIRDILIALAIVLVFFAGYVPLLEIIKNFSKDRKTPPPDKKTVFYKIVLPAENESSLEEMQMFFSAVSSVKKQDGSNQLTFEIHSDGGKVSFYLITNDGIFSVIRSSLETRFPGTSFVAVLDPLASFPLVWETGKYDYKEFRGLELGYSCDKIDTVSVSKDLMPSLSWRSIQNGSNPPTNDPIIQIITALEELKNEEYAVLQLILKPSDMKRDDYKKEFDAVRTALLNNPAVDGAMALTDEEKRILNEINRKINSECYSTKTRFAYFTKDTEISSNINWETVPLTFLQQFKTPYQNFQVNTPYDYTNPSSNLGIKYLNKVEVKKVTKDIFESVYTTKDSDKDKAYKKLLNKNFGVESEYRKRQLYVAFVSRELEEGGPAMFMDVESLACIFHFPVTHNKMGITSKLQGFANETVDVGSSWSTAPSNLPF